MALDRIFDTAKDCRLGLTVPALLEALHTLTPESWESCLHTSTPPVLRAAEVRHGILNKGLGPIGDFNLPVDLWRSVVLEFYHRGLPDFHIEESWEDGERQGRGVLRWVSPQVDWLLQVLRGAGIYEVPQESLPPNY